MGTKVALMTGITGQDGSYLAEFLLEKGLRSSRHRPPDLELRYGTDRSSPEPHGGSASGLHLHYGDLGDGTGLRRILEQIAARRDLQPRRRRATSASASTCPSTPRTSSALGTLRLLEAIRDHNSRHRRQVRFYQASSSEMFGKVATPQNETTPFHPRSPYACAKVLRALAALSTTARLRHVRRRTASSSTTNRRAAARRS